MPACRNYPAALLFVAAATLAAQSADWSVVQALAPGTRVRVEAARRKVSGQVQSAGPDAIVVRSGAKEETLTRAEVARLDLRKRSHRGRNTLIGLAVGAGAGIGIAVSASGCSGFGCIGSRAVEVGAPVGLGALGAVIGAVIPTGGWRELYRARIP